MPAGSATGPRLNNEALEFVMIVRFACLMLHLVMRLAIGDVFLGADAEAEQQFIAKLAVAC